MAVIWVWKHFAVSLVRLRGTLPASQLEATMVCKKNGLESIHPPDDVRMSRVPIEGRHANALVFRLVHLAQILLIMPLSVFFRCIPYRLGEKDAASGERISANEPILRTHTSVSKRVSCGSCADSISFLTWSAKDPLDEESWKMNVATPFCMSVKLQPTSRPDGRPAQHTESLYGRQIECPQCRFKPLRFHGQRFHGKNPIRRPQLVCIIRKGL